MKDTFSFKRKLDSDSVKVVPKIDSRKVVSSDLVGIGGELINKSFFSTKLNIGRRDDIDIVMVHNSSISEVRGFYLASSVKRVKNTSTELRLDNVQIAMLAERNMVNLMR